MKKFILITSVLSIVIFVVLIIIFIYCFKSLIPKTEDIYIFPFSIEYKINNELFVVNDNFICEYQGKKLTSGGEFNRWNNYLLESGEEDLLVWENENEDEHIKVYYAISESILGYIDQGKPISDDFVPKLFREIKYKDGTGISGYTTVEKLKKESNISLDIELISFEFQLSDKSILEEGHSFNPVHK